METQYKIACTIAGRLAAGLRKLRIRQQDERFPSIWGGCAPISKRLAGYYTVAFRHANVY
jgi:hypothetical protein